MQHGRIYGFPEKEYVVKLPDEETKMYLQSELEKDSFLNKAGK